MTMIDSPPPARQSMAERVLAALWHEPEGMTRYELIGLLGLQDHRAIREAVEELLCRNLILEVRRVHAEPGPERRDHGRLAVVRRWKWEDVG